MKINNIKSTVFVVALVLSISGNCPAQSTEVQQLLLNVEKLSQLKNILSDMRKGYQVISTGYNAIKNISQGNFSIHETFLDGLMMVSPEVRKYARVADIISSQKDIISEYKGAYQQFSSSGTMTSKELDYLSRLYSSLLTQSLDNIDQLMTVITANELRMNDAERLDVIDRIYTDTIDKLTFLRSFNKDTGLMLLKRKDALKDAQEIKALFKHN